MERWEDRGRWQEGERLKNWSVKISVSKNGLKGLLQTFYFVIVTINLKARKGILLDKLWELKINKLTVARSYLATRVFYTMLMHIRKAYIF